MQNIIVLQNIFSHFVSLLTEGLWDTEHPYTRTVGSATSPITKMLAVAGKLWCGCQNTIHVLNPLALNIEVICHSFHSNHYLKFSKFMLEVICAYIPVNSSLNFVDE